MKDKKTLLAILLAAVLCFVAAGVGYGEISQNIKEGYAGYASYNQVRFLEARIDYIMRNPSNYLDVQFIYDLNGILGELTFDELHFKIDTKGKIVIKVNDNRSVFSYTTGSPRKLDCLKDFPLPEDAEVQSEGEWGIFFYTKKLVDSEQAFPFYDQWLSAKEWRRISSDEAPWLETWSLVNQIWQKDEMTLVIFPSFYDEEGRLGIRVQVISSPTILLDEFRRELKTIYKSISALASDMSTDIVVRFTRGITPLGYFYEGEYHLWEE